MSETTETRALNLFTPFRFGIFLALLVFAMFPQVILGVETFVARDYGFFAYPLAHFQRDCFWRGELPFWNPYNQCGVPFLAQWNTMPLYPPSLVYLALPLEWSLGFFCLLHLWFAGLGMFFLARRWTGNGFAAAFAGVAFAFNGFTLNLLMWPEPHRHIRVDAVGRARGRSRVARRRAENVSGGDCWRPANARGRPGNHFLTWLLLLALWIQQLVANPVAMKNVWRFPLVVFLVVALSAVQLLPFLDLVAHAQRQTGYTDLRWSMPGFGLANFLVPLAFGSTHTEGIFFQRGQYWTSSYYLGLGTLWLALLAFWTGRDAADTKSKIRLLGTAAMLALFFALGENTFIYPALRKIIPQLSLITYPVKYVLLVAFLAPLLAAFALARLQHLRGGQKKGFQNQFLVVGAVLFALIAGILFWAWRFPFQTDDVRATLLNGLSRAGFLVLTGAVLFILTRETAPALRRFAPLTLLLVAWLDVFTHEPAQNPTVPPGAYEVNLARTRLAMQPQPALGGSRAMVTPAAMLAFIDFALPDPKNNFLAKRLGYCADCNTLDGVPKTDGFFSLTPRESDGLISLLYGATNADFPKLNDFMGVSQTTAPDEFFHWQARTGFLPLVTAGQKPVFLDDAKTLPALAQNDFDGGKMVFLPPAAAQFVTVTNPTAARVLGSKFATQSVTAEVEAAEPSLVVVAQTYYHNWHVYVDGRPTRLLRANFAFQAFQVSAGRHKIRLAYEDRAFEIGAAVSSLAWLGSLSALLLLRPAK
jgi:hypothetical protein